MKMVEDRVQWSDLVLAVSEVDDSNTREAGTHIFMYLVN
jgi:hypothetical protein